MADELLGNFSHFVGPTFIDCIIFYLKDNAEWTLLLGVARKFLFLSFFLPSFYVVFVVVGARSLRKEIDRNNLHLASLAADGHGLGGWTFRRLAVSLPFHFGDGTTDR